MEPVLFQQKNGKIWIIQNVEYNSYYRALYVANNWANNGINPGYYIPATKSNEMEMMQPVHIIYGITEEGDIYPYKENNPEHSEIYINVLQYADDSDQMGSADGRYAALIEML